MERRLDHTAAVRPAHPAQDQDPGHTTATGPPPGRPVLALTPRETQVLQSIREGFSNRKVGRALGISERTVKVHLHSIFIKLGAGSRTEAVVQGIRSGCISI